MRLLQIDDLTLADVEVDQTLITDQSDYLQFRARRREGSAGSIFFGGAADVARWDTLIRCANVDSLGAVMAVLTGDPQREMRLVAQRLDTAETRVSILASLVSIQLVTEESIRVEFESNDSIWHAETETVIEKSFDSALDHVIPLSVGGNTATAPVIRITPTAQPASPTVYAGWSWRRIYALALAASAPAPLINYPWRLDVIDTDDLVSGGFSQADGDDVRLLIDGIERERNLVAWNHATNSKVWFLIPSLYPGQTLFVDLISGNSVATNPPTLSHPNKPPFDLSTTENGVWKYPLATSGAGLWDVETVWSEPDYGVPGSWRPLLTWADPDDTDLRSAEPQVNSVFGFSLIGTPIVTRSPIESAVGQAAEADAALTEEAARDGVVIYNPLGMDVVKIGYTITNVNAASRLVVAVKQNAGDPWLVIYEDDTAYATATDVPADSVSPLAGGFFFAAVALWPQSRASLDAAEFAAATAQFVFDDALEVNPLDGRVTVSIAADWHQVYEVATEVRLGGGAEHVPPYHSLLIGNARQELGADTPRVLFPLDETLVIDTERRTHEVRTGDLTAITEYVPAGTIRSRVAWDNRGETEEAPDTAWLALVPPRRVVPNGDFATDLSSWEEGAVAAGVTVSRTHDAGVGGTGNGSLKFAISANTGNDDSTLALMWHSKRYPISEEPTAQVSAWMVSSHVDLSPLLALRYFDGNGTELTSAAHESDPFVPIADAEYERASADRVPPNATEYQIGVGVYGHAASATGDVWFDDVATGAVATLILDSAVMGEVDVEIALRDRWV